MIDLKAIGAGVLASLIPVVIVISIVLARRTAESVGIDKPDMVDAFRQAFGKEER